jgi:hypothetical protein
LEEDLTSVGREELAPSEGSPDLAERIHVCPVEGCGKRYKYAFSKGEKSVLRMFLNEV